MWASAVEIAALALVATVGRVVGVLSIFPGAGEGKGERKRAKGNKVERW